MSVRLVAALILLGACTPKNTPETAAVEATPAASPEEIAGAPIADADGNGEIWQVIRGDGFAMAIPDGWLEMDPPDDSVKMVRIGDGIGIPPVDEQGQPLQAGFVVETHPGPYEDPKQLAEELIATLKSDDGARIQGEPYVRDIVLCDGSPAEFVAVEFERPAQARKSLFTQVVSADDEGNGWVTSGYVVTGEESQVSSQESMAAAWLASHVLSFCHDEAKFDESIVRKAYAILQSMPDGPDETVADDDEMPAPPTKASDGEDGGEPTKTGGSRDE